MSRPNKKPNHTPESYSPMKPEILSMAKQSQKKTTYPESFILPDKSTAIPPEVKHIGPAYVPFANEFSYFMDYTGQSYGFIYHEDWRKSKDYALADIITGHAMRPAAGLTPSRDELLRVYQAAGFSPQAYYADPAKDNYLSETDMKELIKYVLTVIEQPVILPMESHWWGTIVIGYKDNGNILITYSFLPHFMALENNAEPQIEEIRDWYNNNAVLTVVGKREKVMTEKEIHQEGLRQICAYLESNIHGEDRHYFDEWESFLRLSTDEMIAKVKRTYIVPGGEHGPFEMEATDDNIWQLICSSHDSTWCNMAERRFYIARFLYQAMEYFPEESESMKLLGDHFWNACEIMGNTGNGYGSEIGDPVNPEIFKNPEVRMKMADCVRRFREADEKGFEMAKMLLNHIHTP